MEKTDKNIATYRIGAIRTISFGSKKYKVSSKKYKVSSKKYKVSSKKYKVSSKKYKIGSKKYKVDKIPPITWHSYLHVLL
jgi:hypothetical protein